jgi:hypothetical protein
MSYNLEFKVENKLLRVEIWGNRDHGDLVNNAKAAWSKVAVVCKENNLSRILVVSHALGEYSTFKAYKINSTLSECGVQPSWKIAFVNLDKDSYQEIEFGETVAVNCGFIIKIFPTEDAAREWL